METQSLLYLSVEIIILKYTTNYYNNGEFLASQTILSTLEQLLFAVEQRYKQA